MIETRYGTFDNQSLFLAADALCKGTKQKEATRRAVAAGIGYLV